MIRTNNEFNDQYIHWINGPGLLINIPSVVQYLNQVFNDLVKIKEFSCKEITTIHGIPRVDTNLNEILPFVGRIIHEELEKSISIILKVEFEVEQRLNSLNLDKNGNPINHEQ
jgi:hypothetical protein